MKNEPEEETYARGIEWALWKRLLGYSLRRPRQVAGFCLAGFSVAAADLGLPLVTRAVVDELAAGTEVAFARHASFYLCLTLLLVMGVWAFIELGGRIRTRISHDIREDGFAKLQELSFAYYDQRPVGWLMARMTSDCERLSQILAWGVLDCVWGGALMMGIVVILLFLNVKLTLVALSVIPLLFWISLVFQRRILASSRKVRSKNSRLTAAFNEAIMGARTTKLFARERASAAEFAHLSDSMLRHSLRNQLQSALYLPIVLTLTSLATGLVLAFGGLEVLRGPGGLGGSAGAISVGTLIVFLTYTAHFFQPVQELAHWFAELQMAQASAERILGLIDEEPAIRDAETLRAPPTSAIETIEFAGVSFAYTPGEPVLSDFDLTVRAGETIALVGSTGGGKSTIVNLLSRFYEPTSGRILLDGQDYRELPLLWLQSKLGIVLQTPHLFSGSVRENLRYGRLDANDDEIESAAKLTGAHDFVLGLEDGYETEVGEGGARLSVGQRQLLSFARALLAKPEILIMDEATSSVDTETERSIQQGLHAVLENRTSFVIAHRLSTIRSADRILVIEQGRIAEQGTHEALMTLRGRYFELYTQQSLRESGRSASWNRGGDLPAADPHAAGA